jgi:hypothetical protein
MTLYETNSLIMKSEVKSEIEPEFNRAIQLRDKGDYPAAVAFSNS